MAFQSKKGIFKGLHFSQKQKKNKKKKSTERCLAKNLKDQNLSATFRDATTVTNFLFDTA